MKQFLYDFFILAYEFGAWLISPFNHKARLWLKGRLNWSSRLQAGVQAFPPQARVVWMHAASLGEFEQGKPIIDALKEEDPSLKVVVSFFSPSGYEVIKSSGLADVITYLPGDTPGNAKRFFDIVKPKLAIWVKYDYWYHHLKHLHHERVPVLLVSAIFWPDSVFFRWYGSLHREMLTFFQHFFVQNSESADLLRSVPGFQQTLLTVSGDTRFDRVITLAENWQPLPVIEDWLGDATEVIVAGSTWPEDDEELAHYVRTNPGKKFIIAPHNITSVVIRDSTKMFEDVVLYSELTGEAQNDKHVLLVDTVGILSRLYRYATICYVGGGFSGSGIHNVLEAAVYGKPVVHGPDFDRYQEAVDLNDQGGSFVAESAITLENIFGDLFSDRAVYKKAADAAKNFVYAAQGSSQEIVRYIYENRLLTRP